ncbi:MAG TPA: CsgG/HfaB family protein [Salinivirgaceae bacterium]|nr:CsgG/HfaB family protein [Salinivirgaceae bacterium]HQA75568.1 CsgG/HfaB family protein [Salinivirgaceae bacterium]
MSKQLIFTAIIILGSFAVKAQDKKVAVFDPAGDVTSTIKGIVREEISATIVNSADYTVLERSLIDKVLEENKFQAGGLVDDSQISEMGKRMGANYVFVTSIASLGSNYHISCKMIEVQTARIDKQKTTRTERGADDLVDVVQRLTKEMFTSTTQDLAQSEVSKEEISTDLLITDGKRVYQKGEILEKQEVRHLMKSNTHALILYEKGLKQRKWGNALLWTGVGSVALGATLTLILDAEGFILISLPVLFVSVPCSIVPKILAKKNICKSVDLYNGGKQSTQVKYNFGITPNSVGLTINF